MRKSLLVAAVVAGSVLLTAPGAGAMTYTLEPGDFDGVIPGIDINLTQQQLGGTLCPCTKIPYPADYVSNQQGVTAITKTQLMPGRAAPGYSLGSMVISTYLANNTPPPGVNFILLGNTSSFNGLFGGDWPAAVIGWHPRRHPKPGDEHQPPIRRLGRPPQQHDGARLPAGHGERDAGRLDGSHRLHRVAARQPGQCDVDAGQHHLSACAPTENLPIDQVWRDIGLGFVADALDRLLRPMIDAAYTNRPNPTAAQLAASAGVQAKFPAALPDSRSARTGGHARSAFDADHVELLTECSNATGGHRYNGFRRTGRRACNFRFDART